MQQTAGHDRFLGCIARRGPRRQVSWVVQRLRAFLNEGDNLTKTRWAIVLAALTAGGSVLAALSADEKPRKGADNLTLEEPGDLGKTG